MANRSLMRRTRRKHRGKTRRKTRRKVHRRKSHKKRKYRTRRRRRKGGDKPHRLNQLNTGLGRLTPEAVAERNRRHIGKSTRGPSEAQIKNALRRIEKREHQKKIKEYGDVVDFVELG